MTDNDPTSPENYSQRDLLLLSQLLYTNGLLDVSSLTANTKKLDEIIQEWFDHKSTKLSLASGTLHITIPPTPNQVLSLYDKLLAQSDCDNTTDLANFLYYNRIEELERIIDEQKNEFNSILSDSKQSS
ncbi:uncharacterized protein PRCAT00002599001 [Priceomyces carsonii]|uniref:uncharacterized protein n=1 Tax=Priceomyces carsonii TaxID=28549 RepID=UPI002ED8BC7F|nr:unnamed protein product [Priceomyces carsonii]